MIKRVGTAKYAHKSNVKELVAKCFKTPVEEKLFLQFLNKVILHDISFDIIKYDKGTVTLISSPDWNTANEPIVGTCYRWKLVEWLREDWVNPIITQNYKQIYHNKWMFVADNYSGFSIERAKQRSALWNSLPDIQSVKNKIGYKDFWAQYLAKYGIPL